MQSPNFHQSRKTLAHNSKQTQPTTCEKRCEKNRHDVTYSNSKVSIYNVTIKNIEDEFPLTAEMNAVNKDVLLNVPNPNYETMHTKYFHLIEIKMNENQAKHSQ